MNNPNKKKYFDFLPSPFGIAIILTIVTLLLSIIFGTKVDSGILNKTVATLGFWNAGFWDLLAFSMQMSLILILGHTLAMTPAIDEAIKFFSSKCTNNTRAILIIAISTMIMGWLNWGLGLIFGAILVRKTGELAARNDWKINYGAIGAAGYAGMMIWHGGLSGSAPLTVAEPDHFLINEMGMLPVSETIFTYQNLLTCLVVLALVPLGLLARIQITGRSLNLPDFLDNDEFSNIEATTIREDEDSLGFEKSSVVAVLIGSLFIISSIIIVFTQSHNSASGFLNLNFINFILFGVCIIGQGSIWKFQKVATIAVKESAGIILQFPLYAGIMGIMKYSGLAELMSDQFVAWSTQSSLPIFTFISAAILNIFVPSGGGQWAVQGPILIEAAKSLNVPMGKMVIAMSYGDQITNMLQPFWALPLLGITGLKASRIIPYCIVIFGVGAIIYLVSLALW
ncbi:TIGR00366 family protein [Marinigracilibium pacificum]|uniref:Short-chain fatty acid transporter n=1 Tax=Marinigracilibium pacificum TaxID=2729599 RepID=A0A848J101_9BACT|nr:TIGR00366 family protein [Marinigracilibium pacificum]NMM49195.1 short-chain fatty acid transporter [Marinigracilibium pacificum]